MHCSKHQMQHCTAFRTITITRFFSAPACFSKYFIKYRMNCTTARMKDPKANEPKWKRNAL